jgi:hypothetical protein|tara:strand:+ start:2922 stop:3425 length:504 start_codon:yes stop_codon:yes gene_type:complete
MISNCSKCDTHIPDERVHLGYRECVECSSVEPYSAHVVYPHKTGAYVQPISSSVKRDLERLDRRAVKVGGKMFAPKVKEFKMPEPKPQTQPIKREQVYVNHQNFSQCFVGCKDTYIKYGYNITKNYVKKLFKRNKISLITKSELVDYITTIHSLDRKTRKKYLNAVK